MRRVLASSVVMDNPEEQLGNVLQVSVPPAVAGSVRDRGCTVIADGNHQTPIPSDGHVNGCSKLMIRWICGRMCNPVRTTDRKHLLSRQFRRLEINVSVCLVVNPADL